MRTVGQFAFTLENLIPVGLTVALNPHVMAGIACYAVSVILWIMVLSRVDVSYAYPLLSVGYVVTALAGKAFFGEPVGFARWAGILVICFGVYLVAKSG